MRKFCFLVAVFLFGSCFMAGAEPPNPGRGQNRLGPNLGQANKGKTDRGMPNREQRGFRRPPPELVFFGLSRKGEETKPFLLSVPVFPPGHQPVGGPGNGQKPDAASDKNPGKGGSPPVSRGFLGIDAQGFVLSKIDLTFYEKEGDEPKPPKVKSVKAVILDVAPPLGDPPVIDKKTDGERQEAHRKLEEQIKAAKEIGTLEFNLANRSDLKSPIMTDMDILCGEGAATINGEEFKLLFISPPPGPRERRGEPQPDRDEENPPPPMDGRED